MLLTSWELLNIISFHELTKGNFRLKKWNLTTLYYRRQRADVLQEFRCIKGIDKVDIGNFLNKTVDHRYIIAGH